MRRLAAAVGTFVLATVPLAAVDPRPAGQLAGFIGIGTTPEFLTEWFRTPPEHTPTIPLVTRFAVGETVYIGFIVTGNMGDETGQSNVTVDVRITKPDGSVLSHIEGFARYAGPVGEKASFVLANPALDLVFDPGDPLGMWSVVAIFHDLVANKGSILEVHIELVAK